MWLAALLMAAPVWAAPTKSTGASKTPAKKPASKLSPQEKQYQAAVKSWHAAASAPAADGARPPLVLVSLNSGERVELEPASDDGGFSARAAEDARWLFRERGSGKSHPIEPLLLDTLYRIQRHFNAPMLRVISGYRAPKPGSHSNHGRGRACDFVVPGASDKDVAELARGFGYRGVGIYPKSGFVHVDIRERSYFWVDNSGPGKKNRERGILSGKAADADREAKARGEIPPLPYRVKPADHALSEPDDSHIDDDDNDSDSDEEQSSLERPAALPT